MRMKRTMAVPLLALVLLVAFLAASCGDANRTSPGAAAGSAATTTEAAAPAASGSENVASAAKAAPVDEAGVDHAAAVASLFAAHCSMCHGSSRSAAHLDLASANVAARLVGVKSPKNETFTLVDAGRPDLSYLIMKVTGAEGIEGNRMPPGTALSPQDIAVLEAWVTSLVPAAAEVAPAK